ncbi:GNAT family N-acetyltransferase [Nostocoides sp. HKS02]|nr:GNAT family N-acetyltransferase [Tetrasphaera sp. HKS02]
MVHTRDRVEPFVKEVLLPHFEVWVADTEAGPVGFMALMAPDQLGHLYIAAPHRDRGLGSRFVALAQDRYPEGLQLWTFQSNRAAQRFYERHGFVAVEWTDGQNEEGAPDVRMEWRPASSGRP